MGKPPCCEKNGVKKGPWSTEEDNILIDYIRKHGHGRWRTLPKNAGLKRCGKSCRLRWTNYLRPDIKRGRFSLEEEQAIVQLHSVLGNKWSAIAAQLPGRTDNEIKNFWNTHIKKKLLRMGIDPVTHAPRLDLLDLHSLLTLYNYSQIQSLNITNIPSSSHQNILTTAPLYNMNVENHPSFDHFPDESQLLTTSLPQLGTNACGFPGFCQRADEYVQEINTPQKDCDGCNNKVKNYGVGSSLSSPLSGSSITLHSSSATYAGSGNEDEIKEGHYDYSTANYDFRNGFYVNGLM